MLSDYIEPSRKINGAVHKLDDIRKIAYLNIDSALYQILENTVSYLSDSYKKIDEMSFKTMEYYKEYKRRIEMSDTSKEMVRIIYDALDEKLAMDIVILKIDEKYLS